MIKSMESCIAIIQYFMHWRTSVNTLVSQQVTTNICVEENLYVRSVPQSVPRFRLYRDDSQNKIVFITDESWTSWDTETSPSRAVGEQSCAPERNTSDERCDSSETSDRCRISIFYLQRTSVLPRFVYSAVSWQETAERMWAISVLVTVCYAGHFLNIFLM